MLTSLNGTLHYCFKYQVALYGKFIIYLVSIFGLSVNVKFLKGIKHFAFSGEVNYVNYFVHWAERMAFIDDMLGERRPVVCTFKVVVMFAEPHIEGLAGLTCINFVACETFKLVNFIFLIFVGLWVMGYFVILGVFLGCFWSCRPLLR